MSRTKASRAPFIFSPSIAARSHPFRPRRRGNSRRMSFPITAPSHTTVILLDAVNGYFDTFASSRDQAIRKLGRIKPDERVAIYTVTQFSGLVMLQDYISSMTVNWMSFVGVIFILVVLFFPRGLLGMMRRRIAA